MASPAEAGAAEATPATPPPPPATVQYLDITTPTPRRRSPRLSKAPATLAEPPRPTSPTPAAMAPAAQPSSPFRTPTPPLQQTTVSQQSSPRRSMSPRRQQSLQQMERVASLSPTTTGLLSNILDNVTPNPFDTSAVIRRPTFNTPSQRSPSPPRRPIPLQRPPSASPEKSAKPIAPPSPA